jgi:D-3-phosphoglycerate dehydrogenase / 2-oxoglutarate reductase
MRIGVITPIHHMKSVVEKIELLGDVFYLEHDNKENTHNFLKENKIDTIICNPNKQNFIIDSELLKKTSVKLINTCSTGLNHIDLKYCSENNIEILSLTKDFKLLNQLPSTSELAFGLMMCLLRNIPSGMLHVKGGGWDYTKFVGRQVKDLNVGIVGFGRLGKMMYNYCKAFGANCVVYDPYVKNIGCDSLKSLVEKSDVVSLHVHVSEETKYMINKEIINHFKPGSYLINTSRGEIIEESAVIEALKDKRISGYGSDVIEDEFNENVLNSPIVNAMIEGENIIITPHVGGMTREGQELAYCWAINKMNRRYK